MGQEEASSAIWSKSVQVAAQVAMVCVAVFSASKIIAPTNEYGGYESDAGAVVHSVEPEQQTPFTNDTSRQTEGNTTDEETMPDPFAGLEP